MAEMYKTPRTHKTPSGLGEHFNASEAGLDEEVEISALAGHSGDLSSHVFIHFSVSRLEMNSYPYFYLHIG